MLRSRQVQLAPDHVATALGAGSDVVLIVDAAAVVRWGSPAADRSPCRPPTGWRDRSIFQWIDPDDRRRVARVLAALSAGDVAGQHRPVTVRAAHADGRWIELLAASTAPDGSGGKEALTIVLRDVTERIDAEHGRDRARAELDFAMSHDAATGLPNRAELERRLERRCLEQDGRTAPTHLLMAKVVDVDRLRSRYGAREVEAIVRSLGRSIRALANPGDVVAVDGIGEFVVVGRPGMTEREVDALAGALYTLADLPISSRRSRVDLRLAVGRTVLQTDRGAAVSLDQLAQAAGDACRVGARTPVTFGQRARSNVSERRAVAADVERGLHAGEFELHYQPIRDVRSGWIAGFEGLVRWNHPERGFIVAGEFLPGVEGTAVIVDLGDFVLAAGCAQLARWQLRLGERAPSLAINVSARQLRRGDFARRVCAELQIAGADPRGLCLELTETHAIEREPRAMAELHRLRETGASIALDDFGTGYSSLQQLRRIAADVLKIDRAFVKDVGLDVGATAIVRAAIDLGAAFGMLTVAEGVTTVEQQRLLMTMGCDRIQGFLIAPALSADLADAMLAAERPEDPSAGLGELPKRVKVMRATSRLALIDEGYTPSEDEVAALAGVSVLDARWGLTQPGPDGVLTA